MKVDGEEARAFFEMRFMDGDSGLLLVVVGLLCSWCMYLASHPWPSCKSEA